LQESIDAIENILKINHLNNTTFTFENENLKKMRTTLGNIKNYINNDNELNPGDSKNYIQILLDPLSLLIRKENENSNKYFCEKLLKCHRILTTALYTMENLYEIKGVYQPSIY